MRLKTPGEPCFHQYGRSPPKHALDLGCGAGDWVIEAASSWASYGSFVTGVDLTEPPNVRDLSGRNRQILSNARCPLFVRGICHLLPGTAPHPLRLPSTLNYARLYMRNPTPYTSIEWQWV